jgi:MFS family permease
MLAGNLFSNTGNFIEQVAQASLIWQLTEDARWLGVQAFASNGPTLVLALFGGALADRLDRRRLLVALMAAWCVSATLLFVLSALHLLTPSLIILIAAMEGVCASTSRPVMSASIQDVVGRERLPEALALATAGFNLARMVGPALGGIIFARFGPTASFGINALTFFVALYGVARMRVLVPPPRVKGAILPRIAEALRHGSRHAGLWRLWWSSALFSILAGPVQGLLAGYNAQALGHGSGEGASASETYGSLLSAMAVGALVGAFAAARLPRVYPRHHLIPVAALGYGVAGLLLGLNRDYAIALVLMGLIGLFHTSFLTSSMMAVQLLAPAEMRARIISVQQMMVLGMMPVGSLIGGQVAGHIGVAPLLVANMVLMIALALYQVTHRVPQIDGEHAHLPPGRGPVRGLSGSRHRRPQESATPEKSNSSNSPTPG